MGPQVENTFNGFKVTTDKHTLDAEIKGFDGYFVTRRNIIYEWAKFNTRVKRHGESVNDFATAKPGLVGNYNYELQCALVWLEQLANHLVDDEYDSRAIRFSGAKVDLMEAVRMI